MHNVARDGHGKFSFYRNDGNGDFFSVQTLSSCTVIEWFDVKGNWWNEEKVILKGKGVHLSNN